MAARSARRSISTIDSRPTQIYNSAVPQGDEQEHGPRSALKNPVEKTPIIDKCVGCKNVAEGDTSYCQVYAAPGWKWELGQCNFATHIKRETKKDAFINPLKLAKMRARGLH